MHRGFNLKLDWYDESYYNLGKSLFESDKSDIKNKLTSFITPTGSLDAAKMQANWFGQVTADIFISHSHQDEKKAIALAAWIKEKFGLRCFIDSCIWENANDLLQILDKTYIYDKESRTYDYLERNRSTSHIHMMLSTALTMMIDNSESLFFLNTSASVVAPSQVKSLTHSPWIYFEITTSKFIRKRPKKRPIRKSTETFSKAEGDMNESALPNFDYQLYLSHLTDLTASNLDRWNEEYNRIPSPQKHALDILYDLKPLPMSQNFL